MQITEANYFSKEVRNKYLDVSTFKDFVGTPAKEGCESRSLAALSGEYEEEKTTALLLGNLFDEMMLGTPESLIMFKADNPELFSSRGPTKGMLKSEFQIVNQMVDRCRQDSKFMKYLEGEHQKIMTGTLFGIDWRIKMDNYKEHKAIVDLKSTEDIRKSYYSPSSGRCNAFIYYDYILQAAIYQEIVFQNTGERLPFYFNCVSKQKVTDLDVIFVDNQTLHDRIYGNDFYPGIANEVENIRLLMNGDVGATSCNHCSYCLSKKKIERPIHFLELEGELN